MNWRPPVTGVIIALTVRLGMYGRKERRARGSKARSKKGRDKTRTVVPVLCQLTHVFPAEIAEMADAGDQAKK
jgi:hypothetical protein